MMPLVKSDEEKTMATARSNAKRVSKARERALGLRTQYWPHVQDDLLWHRLRHAGYITIPRTLPVLMNIIDSLSKNQPAGRTYFGLWSRTFDESLVIIENPMSFAFEAGFSGERAVTTWRQRMKILQELGFIDARPGSSGEFHYVLIPNPHKVVWALKSRIQQQLFMQLHDRAIEIGATDMQEPVAPEAKAKPPKRARKVQQPTV